MREDISDVIYMSMSVCSWDKLNQINLNRWAYPHLIGALGLPSGVWGETPYKTMPLMPASRVHCNCLTGKMIVNINIESGWLAITSQTTMIVDAYAESFPVCHFARARPSFECRITRRP